MKESGAIKQTFSTRTAARILAVSPDRIRYWVRRRLVKPSEMRGRGYQFAFNELLVMRLTKELLPTHRHLRPIRRCFERLGTIMTPERPVTSLKLFAEDGRLIVRDGGVKFEVDSGQQVLDFDVARFAREIDSNFKPKVSAILDNAEQIEETDPARTIRFYSTVAAAEPTNANARMKLGALLEKTGNPREAIKQYLHAATIAPDNAQAHLRLGAIYRMRERLEQSIKSFVRTLKIDPDNLEAHRNLAELYEEIGRKREALRHLSAIHRLTRSE
jgi:hypothetical protein